MNKRGQNYHLDARNWSASAVAVVVAAFMAFTGHWGWAIGFFVLAIILAIIPYL